MSKNYATATIRNVDYDPRKRIKIVLNKDEEGLYVWYSFFQNGEKSPANPNGYKTIKEAQRGLIDQTGKNLRDLKHDWKVE